MKNYYTILELTFPAGEEAVKRSYRRLALRYHPDRNPTPEAEERFKEINEAYEVLGDTTRKLAYDTLITALIQRAESPPARHRDPRYRRSASAPPPAPDRSLWEAMQRSLPYTQWAARIAFVFCVVWAVDFFLPPRQSEETVTRIVSQLDDARQLTTDRGHKIKLGMALALKFRIGHVIVVYRTRMMGIPLRVEDRATGFRARVPTTVYGSFSFVPFVLLLTSGMALFVAKPQQVEFLFNLGVVSAIMLIITVLLTIFHSTL